METSYSEASFAPILPKLRSYELIQKDLSSVQGDTSDEITQQKIFEIEQLIKQADTAFKTKYYSDALDKFNEARARIYAILYPSFNVSKYMVSYTTMLPQDSVLHNNILQASANISNIKIFADPAPILTGVFVNPAPVSMSSFITEAQVKSRLTSPVMENKSFNPSVSKTISSLPFLNIGDVKLASVSNLDSINTTASEISIQNSLYQGRIKATTYSGIQWSIGDYASNSTYLTQLYGFALPVKIGDCYAQLGQYAKAEAYYLQACDYTFLNKNIEGVQLWIKLAKNALNHANSVYKKEMNDDAKNLYQQIINTNGSTPASLLYTNAALSVATAQAITFIQNIATRPLPVINLEIAELLLTANSFLLQLENNLDYYGLLLSPIHTFEYLQSVARANAQQAIQAEREFVTFKSQQETEAASRRDLETTFAMAQAETAARFELWKAAQDDEIAAQSAITLATKRRDDAITQKSAYETASLQQVWGQAASMALSGGEDAYWSEIKELVDKLNRGETIEGPGPKIAAAEALRGGLKTREYELQRMQDTIDELTSAIIVAQNQLNASHGRTVAAEIAYQAAIQRQSMAEQAINAFDNEFFTPDAWSKMSDIMRDISRDFLFRAIRIAKLMERAYNFDNDSTLSIIKNEYGFAVANTNNTGNATLLGGDSLQNDIESFTYNAIANKTRKSSKIKDVVSIASNFPMQFEAFKRTGLLSFETDLYEFDRLHPGFYEQRIEVIEVEIIGVIPDTGLNGTFRAGGVTRFRRKNNTQGERVHQIDTSALSDFVLRNDMFLYTSETGVRGLFQGFGLGSSFELHLPKRSNDFDFRRIFDINLVFYYTAKFDEVLKETILALPVRAGEMEQLYNFSLRYDFPDAWYSFYKHGKVTFQLERIRLPFNQQNFKNKSVSFRVGMKQDISNVGVEMQITAPNGTSITATTDENGVISSADPVLTAINNQDPLGNWTVEILSGDALTDNGTLKLDRVYNIQVGLECSFEYVPEVI